MVYNSLSVKKINFKIFIFLLPVCSLGYFVNISGGLSFNASIYPFILGSIFTIYSIFNRTITNTNICKKIITMVGILYLYIIINLFCMSYIFNFYNISLKNKTPIQKFVPSLIMISVIFFIILFIVDNISTNKDLINIIKIVFFSSSIFIILYGYIQIFAFEIPNSIFTNIYIFISDKIDFSWGSDQSWNYVLMNNGRINLTTPEASQASNLISLFILPFLFSSLVNGYSVFKYKLEKLVFLLLMPIIFFCSSSTMYIAFLFELLISMIILLNRKKKLFIIYLMLSIFVLLTFMYFILNNSMTSIYINKLFDINNTSTNTRNSLIQASIEVFKKFPINGCGFDNSGFFTLNLLPDYSFYNTELISYIYNAKYWFRGPIIVEFLTSNGLIGFLIIIYIIYKIISYLNQLSKVSKLYMYMYNAFLIFAVGFFIEGFNSSSVNIMFPWAMIGIYISLLNLNKENLIIQKVSEFK